jgi:hypothetical protein
MQPIIVDLICVLGIALSLKSMVVLGRHAVWTSVGWGFTAIYLAAVIVQVRMSHRLPGHGEYILLAALTVAFVIAGIRDEPQAEPWWWPAQRGSTRAQKRRTI